MAKKSAADPQQGESLLATKLVIPQLGARIVRRSRLTALLQAGMERRVTTVVAPAGYGKTTLLGEWLSTLSAADWRVVWVSLDAFDNAPLRLWFYIAAGLRRIFPNLHFDPQHIVRPGRDPQDPTLLNPLFNEIAQLPSRLCLILDDYQVIHDEHIHRSVDYLIDHQPANLHLVLASRVAPPLHLARLRAQRQLAEVTAQELSFTLQEASALLSDVILLKVEPELLASLLEATEGWVAGLQLIALSWQGRAKNEPLSADCLHGNRQIFQYLTEEILSQQGEEIQDLLVKTSILEELTAPLCDALLGRSDGQKLLERIEQANLFVVCLDERQRWYRYHPLFAEALRLHLERADPGLVQKLHRTACAWLLEHGQPRKAVAHALAAGDLESAATIVDECAMQSIIEGDLASLVQWISHFSEEMLKQRPRLGVYSALANVQLGQRDAVEPTLQMVEQALDEAHGCSTSPEHEPLVRWEVSVIRAVMDCLQGRYLQGVRRGVELLETAPKDDVYLRGFLNHFLAEAYAPLGDLEAAIAALERGCQFALEHDLPMQYVHTRCRLALMRKRQGRLREAEREYRKALRFARRCGLDAGSVVLPQTGLLEIAVERNALDVAQRQAKEASWSLDQLEANALHQFALGLMAVRLARYYATLQDAGNAHLYLGKAIQSVEGVGELLPEASPELVDARVRVPLLLGEQGAEYPWLKEQTASLTGTERPTVAEQAAWARVCLAQHEAARALAILADLIATARQSGLGERLLEALILQALAFRVDGQEALALGSIGEALQLAEPEGYARIFIDEGEPMHALLAEYLAAQEEGSDEPGMEAQRSYVQRLSAAFERAHHVRRQSSSPAKPGTIVISPLVEPLSDRELEVLGLLVAGNSTLEVAAALVISKNTAKAHVKSIYRKLGIHTRRALLRQVYELGLLKQG